MNNVKIRIRPWASGDLPLLEQLLGTDEMMAHLGGAEGPEAIARRHERYCAGSGGEAGQMFVVCANGADVGSVGFWSRVWEEEEVWEVGWSVIPSCQGRGVATRAAGLLIDVITGVGRHRFVHAFPSQDNAASNAICRRLGFEHRGVVDFEYPVGHLMECIDWRLDLSSWVCADDQQYQWGDGPTSHN